MNGHNRLIRTYLLFQSRKHCLNFINAEKNEKSSRPTTSTPWVKACDEFAYDEKFLKSFVERVETTYLGISKITKYDTTILLCSLTDKNNLLT